MESLRDCLPNRNHIVIHSLQFFLRGVEGVGWRIKLIGLETLIREVDLEGLIIFLLDQQNLSARHSSIAISNSFGNTTLPQGQHLYPHAHSQRLS